MRFKMYVTNQEYGTYFHGQENCLTDACFESLNIERLGWGEIRKQKTNYYCFPKSRLHDNVLVEKNVYA